MQKPFGPAKGILDALLIVASIIFALALLDQSYSVSFSVSTYLLILTLFVIVVLISIVYANEIVAVANVFIFSIAVRLMFYVYSRFSIFPFGDSYAQYDVFKIFADASPPHAFLLPLSGESLYAELGLYLSGQVGRYSQWPGFQILAISFSQMTGLGTFDAAMILTFVLYIAWFVVVYALVKTILKPATSKFRNLSAFCLAITTSLPTFEIPPYFKYDFAATVILMTAILLLIFSYEKRDPKILLLLPILGGAIVVTHPIVTVVLLALFAMTLFGLALRLEILRRMRHSISYLTYDTTLLKSLSRALAIILVIAITWSILYSTSLIVIIRDSIPKLLASFSPSTALRFSRVSSSTAIVLGSLTPKWLLSLLSIRDSLVIGLLAVGAILLLLRPSILGRLDVALLLLSIVIITFVTVFVQALNYNDRAFLLFAPILGSIIVLPLAKKIWGFNLIKILYVVIAFVLMFSIGVGFWGSSYAPVYLYNSHVSAVSFGQQPLTWQSLSSYMTYSTGSNCTLTNEIYTTSLAVPVSSYNSTFSFQSVLWRPGCIMVMYYNLTTFENSYALEPEAPAPTFSLTSFSAALNTTADRVFSGGNATVYYFL